ncbi:MAG: universal stress protein [Bacillota bacterium]
MQRILIATDGSEHAEKVVDKGLELAEAFKAKVTVMTVVVEYVFSPRIAVQFTGENWEQINQHLKEEAEELLAKAAKPFEEKGLSVETKIIMGHQGPADAICGVASEGNYDLVMVGSRGLRGVKEMFLGSVSNKVAHCTEKNVYIVKQD